MEMSKLTLEETQQMAEKALGLQKHMASVFGPHTFYKTLAIMAAITDAHYRGGKSAEAKVLSRIPNEQVFAEKAKEILPDVSKLVMPTSVEELGKVIEAYHKGSFDGAKHYLINKLTEHE